MHDKAGMERALAAAASVRATAHPNPWVGCVLETASGAVFEGATCPPGGPHAEIVALEAARAAAGPAAPVGATAYVTLEPCAHTGRTGPCADALLEAGVGRVVVGLEDPDPRVAGLGVARLRAAGVSVEVGVLADRVTRQLAPYLKQRRTGRPWVVLKLAATLDGRTAAADGSSQWITSEAAREDAHRLRAESDVIVVGAGTVRADDPSLTVRLAEGPSPRRVVLGSIPEGARVLPAESFSGPPDELLTALGATGAVQVLVEGGATVAHAFHAAGLVDEYVVYLAPALAGGDDAVGLFRGDGAKSIDELWRGSFVSVSQLGPDVRLVLAGGE